MPFKAIIFDLDGTIFPNKKNGVPSEQLSGLINKIKDKVFICAATGRRVYECRHIFKMLGLTSPCIILGGTQIIDPVSEKVLWEKLISVEVVANILETARQFNYFLLMSNESIESPASEKIVKGPENIIYIMNVKEQDTDRMLDKLKQISEVIALPVPSYSPACFDIHITHKGATKKQALEVLFEMLNVKKKEVIGFGDGDNDLPIFEAVGYKVAMDNASQELKDMADLVAPSAEEDGVAQVLKKIFA